MSSNCSNCSDCFQTGPHKSTVGVNGNTYIQMHDFNNNSNNKPIKFPAIYPKPPTSDQRQAIISGLPPAPFDIPDYFQDYQLYNKSNYNFNESLKNAYQLPNDKCILPKVNRWTEYDIEQKLNEFPDLKIYMDNRFNCYRLYDNNLQQKENWQNTLSIRQLREILNYNSVFKYYPHNEMKEVLKHYMCYY